MGHLARSSAAAEKAYRREQYGPMREHYVFAHTGCPKCGAREGLRLHFCSGYYDPMGEKNICEIRGEHMHGQCEACGFPWLEQTKDAAAMGERATPADAPRLIGMEA